MRPLISPNEKDLNEDEKTEQNISDPFSRSSDTVKPSYMFHVNTRIWVSTINYNWLMGIEEPSEAELWIKDLPNIIYCRYISPHFLRKTGI